MINNDLKLIKDVKKPERPFVADAIVRSLTLHPIKNIIGAEELHEWWLKDLSDEKIIANYNKMVIALRREPYFQYRDQMIEAILMASNSDELDVLSKKLNTMQINELLDEFAKSHVDPVTKDIIMKHITGVKTIQSDSNTEYLSEYFKDGKDEFIMEEEAIPMDPPSYQFVLDEYYEFIGLNVKSTVRDFACEDEGFSAHL